MSAAPFSRVTLSYLRIFSILFCGVLLSAQAHEANLVTSKAVLHSDGSYQFEVSIDVISSLDPALNDTVSPEEAAMAVTDEINLRFDEEEFHPNFGPLKKIDVPDKEDVTRLYTEFSGQSPKDAKQFLVHLSQEAQVYLAMVVFKDDVQDRRAHILFPGEYSRPIDLDFMGLELVEGDPFERDNPPNGWESFRIGLLQLTDNGAQWAVLAVILCLFARNLSDCLMHGLCFAFGSMVGHSLVTGYSSGLPTGFAAAIPGICVLLVATDNVIRQKMTWSRYVMAFLAGSGMGVASFFPLIEMESRNFVIFHFGQLLAVIIASLLTWIVVGAVWQKEWYRWKILFPASLVAAGASLYWIIAAIFHWQQ